MLLGAGDSLASRLSLPGPRLQLRLSLLYRPLWRGGVGADRETLRESWRRWRTGERDTSERGDKERVIDRGRPRDGDREREGMLWLSLSQVVTSEELLIMRAGDARG